MLAGDIPFKSKIRALQGHFDIDETIRDGRAVDLIERSDFYNSTFGLFLLFCVDLYEFLFWDSWIAFNFRFQFKMFCAGHYETDHAERAESPSLAEKPRAKSEALAK